MAFAANQELGKGKLRNWGELKTLNGELARLLGKAFLSTFAWSRPVPVDFSKFDAFAKGEPQDGGELKWRLAADSTGKRVSFILKVDKKELEGVTLIKDVSQLVERAAEVVNLQRFDPTMVKATGKIARKLNDDPGAKSAYDDPRERKNRKVEDKEYEPDEEAAADFSQIDNRTRIVLSGHGGGSGGGPGPFVATKFGGRSAKDVVTLLREANLPQDYAGTIYLSACHSAAGYETGESFAEVVRDLLHKAGYKRLSVAGTAGAAKTNSAGEKVARPAVYEKDLDDTIDKVEQLVEKLRADLEEYTNANSKLIIELRAKVALAKAEYDSCVELVDSTELPPEAISVVQRTLIEPLKTAYESLNAELEVHENHTQALTRAAASEQQLLEKLMRVKAAPNDDAMTEAIKDEGLRVKEWWGVFGPKHDEDTRRAKKGFQVLDNLASGVGKLRDKLKSKKSK